MIVISLAELMNTLASEEHPSSGRWHIHDSAPLLVTRLAQDLDALHEANLGLVWNGTRIGCLPRARFGALMVVALSKGML